MGGGGVAKKKPATNSKYTSFSAAVASNATEALLVIGVFLAIGSVDLNIVSTLASSIPSLSEVRRQAHRVEL